MLEELFLLIMIFDFFWKQILMEGLVDSSRITSIRTHFRQKNLAFVPTSTVQFTKSLHRNRNQVGMEHHHKSLGPIAASIQPVEASSSSRFGNMLPSKGNLIDRI